MAVYDVGADVRFFILMRSLVDESGQVYAVEPDPEVVCELVKNVHRNDCDAVSVVCVAVWSSTGSVGFASADPQQSPNRGTGGEVVRGARGLLAESRPVIICEVHSPGQGRNSQESLDLLSMCFSPSAQPICWPHPGWSRRPSEDSNRPR